MFDFKDELLLTKDSKLTIENILNRISETMIWRFYLGVDFKLGEPFCATYRTDNNPSFSIYVDSRGRLMGKDFGRSFHGSVFDYVMMLYNVSLYESCIIINNDLKLNLVYDDNSLKITTKERKDVDIKELKRFDKTIEKTISNSNLIQTKVGGFLYEDVKYWNSFGISLETLKFYNVYRCEKLFHNKRLIYTYSESDPAYCYYFPKTEHIKIYFPKRKGKYRFYGNVNNYEDIQGYYQCDVKAQKDGKFLILTKSLKDVMLLREYGLDSMSIHGEKHRFNDDFIRHIKKYYPKIISLYDKDLSGVQGAKYLWKEHGIIPEFLPKKFCCKDITDLYKYSGKQATNEFIQNLKQKYNV